jgi:cytochrome b561
MIALSLEAFKVSALANGGAAVALLAYLGDSKQPTLAAAMQLPMFCFLMGLVFCALSILFSYFNHRSLARELDPNPAVAAKPSPCTRSIQLAAAVSFYVVSLITFVLGAVVAVMKYASA